MTTTAEPLKPVRILLVDDDALVCKVVQRLLQTRSHFRVHVVHDGTEALDAFAAEGPFDLLLTDIRLQGMTGLALAQQLRAANPGLKVIFMSGDVPREFAQMHATVEKPFNMKKLLELVARVLESP